MWEATLELTVIDATGSRTEQVSVPDTVAAGRIVDKLVELLGLPVTGPEGQSLSYSFRHEQSGEQIDDHETLAGAGVNEHDVLRLIAETETTASTSAGTSEGVPGGASTMEHTGAPTSPQPRIAGLAQAPTGASRPEERHGQAVLSPPPPELPPQPTAAGGRWSPLMAVAVIILAVAMAGVAVAIIASRGGNASSHLLANTDTANAGTVRSSGSAAASTAEAPSGGTAGEDATATTSTTAGEGALPDVPAQQLQSEIQQMLLSWHEDVVHGNYRAAWELLSQRKQAQDESGQGYATWVKNQSTLRPYLDPAGLQVSIQSTEPSSGVAQVDVTGMTWSKPGASCTEWSGITWAKYEDGAWRYDPGYSTTPQREREWKSRFSELLGGSC